MVHSFAISPKNAAWISIGTAIQQIDGLQGHRRHARGRILRFTTPEGSLTEMGADRFLFSSNVGNDLGGNHSMRRVGLTVTGWVTGVTWVLRTETGMWLVLWRF